MQCLAAARRVLDIVDVEAEQVVGAAAKPGHVLQGLHGEAGMGDGVGFVESVGGVGEEGTQQGCACFELDGCNDGATGGGQGGEV